MNLQLALTSAAAFGLLAGCVTEPVHGPGPRVAIQERAVIRLGPPAPREEIIIAAPGPREQFVWDPGHWRWNGAEYVWDAGHWIKRPHARAEWIASHWTQMHGEWVLIEGHWR